MRGVAILAVLVWHYTDETYAKLLPWGDRWAGLPIVDQGWAGVNLFFLISGYVILMTLERCRSFGDFLLRRWLRLFPAMLIASLLIFSASQAIGERMPHGRADWVDVVPGLTFISPPFWSALLGRPVDELDGVFWTLYVEVGFYLTFGALFFLLGWRRALVGLTILWLGVFAAARFGGPAIAWAVQPLQWIGAEYFGWFVSGALFFKATGSGSARLFAGAILLGLISVFTSGLWQPDDVVSRIALASCVAIFAAAQRVRPIQSVLSSPILLFVGVASYPLYLLHNELGIGLMNLAGPHLPHALLLTTMAILVLLSAWLIARYVEPALRAAFSSAWTGKRSRISTSRGAEG